MNVIWTYQPPFVVTNQARIGPPGTIVFELWIGTIEPQVVDSETIVTTLSAKEYNDIPLRKAYEDQMIKLAKFRHNHHAKANYDRAMGIVGKR